MTLRPRARLTGAMFACALVMWPAGARLAGDEIHLKDGTVLQGRKVGVAPGRVAFRVGGEVRWFDAAEVVKVVEGPVGSRPAGAGRAEGAGGYEIRFDRAFRPGDVVRIAAECRQTETQRTTRNGNVLATETVRRSVALEAEMKVLAADTAGRPIRAVYAIGRLRGSVDDKPVGLAGEGLTVLAKAGEGGTEYELPAGELDAQTEALLDLVLSLEGGGAASDAAFGGGQSRKPGERWEADPGGLLKALGGTGLTCSRENVAGRATLAEVRRDGNGTVLRVELEATAKGFTLPMPAEARVVSSRLAVREVVDLPAEASLPWAQQAAEMTMDVTMQVGGAEPGAAGAVLVEVSTVTEGRRRLVPVRWSRPLLGAKDPAVRTALARLGRAKVERESALAAAKAALAAAVKLRYDQAVRVGNLAAVKQYDSLRRHVAAEGELPLDAPSALAAARARYEAAVRAANGSLARAYAAAVRECTRAGDIARAEAIQAEMDRAGEDLAEGFSYRLGRGYRWPAFLEQRRGVVVAAPGGVRTAGRVYVRTRRADFLSRDFIFDVVYEAPENHTIAFVGIGPAVPGRAYQEPSGSVNLRIHGPGRTYRGEVALTKSGPIGGTKVGRIDATGTHRVRIYKKGPSVTFSIDVNNDGSPEGDISKTIDDLPAFAPFLNEKNSRLFFGGGSVVYKSVRLVVLR